MKKMTCAVAVIGAGAAGLNAMDELLSRGVDAVLFADDITGGTSINSGSDKQTYYKLSLAGAVPDSVDAMARKFFAGGGMQGYHARAMAALSARSFMKLALLGVPFPQNEWGEYVGYQTDHDQTARATSAGPLTSKMMAECLMKSVKSRGARIVNGANLIKIHAENGAVRGALFRTDEGYLAVGCGAMILATGGPACVYGRRVYPQNQVGATGAALRAGAMANNLCYWQYGLASTGVRWNVSGSYQQAIPEYVDGNGAPIAPDMPGRLDRIFLKGYQWPFDSARADASAAVDRAVKAVSDAGGRAFMDFTRDPVAGNFDRLSEEARGYLKNCSALKNGAFERLMAINPLAVEFYRSHGVDLKTEPLEIAVCAQHSNGGILVDENWQTTVKNLYAAGECSGVFGAYRPGGSALNETQVGSLRAVQHIARTRATAQELADDVFEGEIAWLSSGATDENELAYFQRRMDECAGAVRSLAGMRILYAEVCARLETLRGDYALRDVLWVQKYALSAMIAQADYAGNVGHIVTDAHPSRDHLGEYAFVTDKNGTHAQKVCEIPEGDQWFERVWKKFMEENR
jgi:succinate dehydrogenase/fumarate reductase flavoprotein subunit